MFAIFELHLSLKMSQFKVIVYENPNWNILCVFKQDSVECANYAVEDALDDRENLYLFDCAPGKYPRNRLAKIIVFSSPKEDIL